MFDKGSEYALVVDTFVTHEIRYLRQVRYRNMSNRKIVKTLNESNYSNLHFICILHLLYDILSNYILPDVFYMHFICLSEISMRVMLYWG